VLWPDDSSFLLCTYGVLPLSSNVYTSIPSTQNRVIISSDVRILKNLQSQNFEKITFTFSPNAQSLRLWKSSLTKNWIHSTIFENLIISYLTMYYATSCSYVLSHLSGILPVSISVAYDDITCLGGQSNLRDVPDYDISLLSNCMCPSDYHHFLWRHM
jgi:hypothetical protein